MGRRFAGENMMLSDAKPGAEVTVLKVVSGEALRARLSELGVYEGAKVRVVKNDFGPLVLESHGARLALGRGQAAKIEVDA